MRLFSKHTLALAALAATSPLLFAQAAATSSVQLYGVVDVAYRHISNAAGSATAPSQMIGGGMSESRWGVNVTEDLGAGLKALANLESRFTADDGSPKKRSNGAPAEFFQQSWVGLQSSSFGRVSLGRQYNALFDLVTTTYASFPDSPYMDAYKPELGMALGARANNMVKYLTQFGPVRASVQYSFDESNKVTPTTPAASIPGIVTGAVKTVGGYVRYADEHLAVGAGYLTAKSPGTIKVDAWTLGGSYRTGGWYFNTGYALNKRKNSYAMDARGVADSILMADIWSASSSGGFLPGAGVNPANIPGTIGNLVNHANKRQMLTLGVGYQITPQLNLGAHFFHAKQSGSLSGAFNGKANFLVAVADYAFSKRTDAYLGVDHTRVSGGAGMALDANGARSRTGFTTGLRHRF